MIACTKGTAIRSVMAFHPSHTEDNQALLFQSTSAAEIVHHTGIRFRKIADSSWSFHEYSCKAVNAFCASQKIAIESIDLLVCVTQSGGLSIPSLSYFLHDKLNLESKTLCLDVNLGCSGYVQGLHLVQSVLASFKKIEANALLVCGDFSSHLIDPNDQSVRPIFSDAVSVTHVVASEQYAPFESIFSIDSNGKGREAIFLDENGKGKLTLNGIDVFNYSMKLVPANIKQLQAESVQLDLMPSAYIFHQANKIINDSLKRTLKLNDQLVPSSLYNYGNTASASIPLTLCAQFGGESFQQKYALMCGFGIGFSVASGMIFLDTDLLSSPVVLDL